MTPDMLNLQWEKMALYPAGYFVRNIAITPTVKLPGGLERGDLARRRDQGRRHDRLQAGLVRDPGRFADVRGRAITAARSSPTTSTSTSSPTGPRISPPRPSSSPRTAASRSRSSNSTGGKHFDEYEFLLALTDELGGIGLEHLRSSENSQPRDYFTAWDKGSAGRDLLAHEFNHSWNGKYRRGADLWTPDYNTPMQNSLLWVYEGQTQFWGNILSARSGMMPVEDVKSELARTAAYYDTLPGRSWRPLIDTTNDPIISARRPQALPELPAVGGLLFRRHADLARCRQPDSRDDRRQALDRRFRARLLRRQPRRPGHPDLSLRRCRRDAQRRSRPTTGAPT